MASIKKMSALLIPLILSIIVNLVLIFVIVQMNSKMEEKVTKAKREQESANRYKREAAEAKKKYQSALELFSGGSGLGVDDIRASFLSPRQVDKLNKVSSIDDVSLLRREDRKDNYDTFEEYIPNLVLDRAALLPEFKRQKVKLYKLEERSQKDRIELEKQLEEKRGEIGKLQEDIQTVQAEKEQQAKEFSDTKTRWVYETQKLRQAIEEQQKAHNNQIAKLESIIAEREARIRDLVKKSAKTLDDLQPDGEVVLADTDLGFAWIDLGRVNNIRKGLKFKVFRYIKGGRPKKKGIIEVKNVMPNTAFCAILETMDEKDPIIKGDSYVSPLFDKNEQKIFVFAGELTNPRYTRHELIKKIEETGAKVDKEITVETDFLVAGKDAEAEESFRRAIQLGVIIMRESDLFEYLGD